MKRQACLYFLVIGVFLLLISGGFLSEGLSRVGLDNAVVSQRMAEGFEDFWLPSLSSPGNPDRLNYLPLGYWLESQWYNLFGDNSFMAEKVYSVLTFFIIAVLITWIWRLAGMPERTGWLPLLCWLTIPIVSWSATNNLLESTMTMFVLLSVAFMFKSELLHGRDLRLRKSFHGSDLRPRKSFHGGDLRPRKSLLYKLCFLILSALAMELAFMVKGFSGLFPIFFPTLYWLIVDRRTESGENPSATEGRERILSRRIQAFKYAIFSTAVIVMVWIVTLSIVIINSPEVYNHLYNYLHHQMIGGVLHVQTVSSRFYIVYVLVLQAIIPLLIIGIISLLRIKSRPFYHFMFYRYFEQKLTALQVERSKRGWLFLAVGLSGILPIMLGLKQQEFYIVPTLPFFALAMGCLLYDLLQDWLENINTIAHRVLIAISVLLFGSGLVLNVASLRMMNSNEELLSDMKLILPYLSGGETLSVSAEMMQDAVAAEYFYRYKQVIFDSTAGHNHFVSIYSDVDYQTDSMHYCDMQLPTQRYKLFELTRH